MLVIQGLKEHITKRSDVLERDAQWEKSVSHPMKSTLEMAFVCYKIENRKIEKMLILQTFMHRFYQRVSKHRNIPEVLYRLIN